MEEEQIVDYTNMQIKNVTLDATKVLDPTSDVGTGDWYDSMLLWIVVFLVAVLAAPSIYLISKLKRR